MTLTSKEIDEIENKSLEMNKVDLYRTVYKLIPMARKALRYEEALKVMGVRRCPACDKQELSLETLKGE